MGTSFCSSRIFRRRSTALLRCVAKLPALSTSLMGSRQVPCNKANKLLIHILEKPLFIYVFSIHPIKDRSQCYASLHCDEYEHLRMWHIYNASKMLYRDRSHVVGFLLHLETNKSCQIMWRLNTSTCICNILVFFVCVIKSPLCQSLNL